jgi:hypothetical protein
LDQFASCLRHINLYSRPLGAASVGALIRLYELENLFPVWPSPIIWLSKPQFWFHLIGFLRFCQELSYKRFKVTLRCYV